jgi:hypothetical protein
MNRLLPAVTAVLTVTVAGLVTGLIPAGANHQFPDVATSSAFHDDIDDFVNAGCATGFPNGTYQPTSAVNRQQIARFVNACGGRVAFDKTGSAPQLVAGQPVDVAEAELTAGALGGGGFVVAIANARVTAASQNGSDYPCEANFRLFQTGGVTEISQQAATLDLDGPVVGATDDTGAVTELIAVEAGATVTVTLRGTKSSNPACNASILGFGDLVLLYVPFDGNGDGGGESLP